ncbi:MAG: hypothetical protein MK082_01315 [Phycisphaerales bacterium]|nr:hypothetical protein [Phycisphaerales bacterium]
MNRIRAQARRLVVLGVIVTVIGVLHLALFSALDSVAPLGVETADNSTLVIDSGDVFEPELFQDWTIRSLVADAR